MDGRIGLDPAEKPSPLRAPVVLIKSWLCKTASMYKICITNVILGRVDQPTSYHFEYISPANFYRQITRHDICQKISATAVLAARILRKKSN